MKKNGTPPESELRRMAEAKLSKQGRTQPIVKEADTLRLVHELQVHQIELEMQNEELVQTRAEAEESYRQYADLYDFAPVGYFTLGRDGTVRRVNLAGTNLLYVERIKLINRRLGLFVAVESRPAFSGFLKKLLSGSGKKTCELAFEKKENGPLIWAHLEATCFEGGQECRMTMVDITERKQMEDELRAAKQQWQTTFDAIGDAICLMDVEGRIISHNRAMQKFLGKSTDEINRCFCYEIVHGTSKPIATCPLVRMKISKRRESTVLEREGRWLEITVDPIFDADGQLISAVHAIVDITQRKQAEEALRDTQSFNQKILGMTPSIVYIFDLTTQQEIFVNRPLDGVLGYDSPQAGAVFFPADVHPDDLHILREKTEWAVTAQDGEIGSREYRVRHADGEWHWIGAREVVFSRDANGKPSQIMGVAQDITQRRQIDEALRESEEKYRRLFDNAILGVFQSTPEGKALSANNAFARMFGYDSPEDALQNIKNVAADIFADPNRRTEIIRLMAENPGLKTFENLYRRKDGSTFLGNLNAMPIRDINGNLIRIEGIIEDITERKQAEEALKESEAKYHLLADNMTDVIWLRDLNLNLLYVSPSEEKIRGYTFAELQKFSFGELLTPASVKIAMELFTTELPKVLTDPTYSPVSTREFEFYRRNGELHSVESKMSIIRDENGNPTSILGQDRDITERKRAEEALKESEEKYRTVADFTYDWESWRATDNTYLYVSPSCERISGHTSAEFLANPNLLTQITHPDDKSMVIVHYQSTANESQRQDIEFDFRILTPNGETRWIAHSCTAVHGKNGQWLGRRESNRDITERKQMENELRESEVKNRALVEAIPDLMFIQNRAGVYLDYHVKTPQLLIAPPEFFLGHSTRDVLPAEQAEALQQKFDLAFQTGEIQIHEYILELADGMHHFETRMNAYDNDKLLSIVRDITKRKLEELELQYTRASLESANSDLTAALAREQQLARTDPLTGINNRRHLFELADHEFEIAARYHQPLSILMFDIDHFKQVNDTFGHAIGDQILQSVTQAACAELRSADVIGRYGGEEFVIVLPMTNAQQAYPLAERIRAEVASLRIPTEKGDALVTLSIGIVEMTHGAQTKSAEELIRFSDEAMYAAKQAGRNRTKIGD